MPSRLCYLHCNSCTLYHCPADLSLGANPHIVKRPTTPIHETGLCKALVLPRFGPLYIWLLWAEFSTLLHVLFSNLCLIECARKLLVTTPWPAFICHKCFSVWSRHFRAWYYDQYEYTTSSSCDKNLTEWQSQKCDKTSLKHHFQTGDATDFSFQFWAWICALVLMPKSFEATPILRAATFRHCNATCNKLTIYINWTHWTPHSMSEAMQAVKQQKTTSPQSLRT